MGTPTSLRWIKPEAVAVVTGWYRQIAREDQSGPTALVPLGTATALGYEAPQVEHVWYPVLILCCSCPLGVRDFDDSPVLSVVLLVDLSVMLALH